MEIGKFHRNFRRNWDFQKGISGEFRPGNLKKIPWGMDLMFPLAKNGRFHGWLGRESYVADGISPHGELDVFNPAWKTPLGM